MATLTREQYKKWNSQAQNGFKLDIEYYVSYGEKTLVKYIKQADGTIIQFKLWYIPEYETVTNEYGCRWNVRTGKQIPMLEIDKLIPSSSGCYIVSPIKDNIQMAAAEKTMKYATLCKISATLDTAEYLKEIA